MKKYVLIMMIVLLLIVSGCGNPKSADNNADNKGLKSGSVDDATNKADDNVAIDQELVNFKCVIADVQTIYFLKNKAAVESPAGKTWIIDDKVYIKMEIQGEDYLIEYPASERNDVNTEDMKSTYITSKSVPNVDCEINVVKESDVALPDLEILSEEGFQNKLTEGMMGDMGIPEE